MEQLALARVCKYCMFYGQAINVTAILTDQVNDVKKKFIILDVTWREKSPQTEFASYFLLSLYYWQVLS